MAETSGPPFDREVAERLDRLGGRTERLEQCDRLVDEEPGFPARGFDPVIRRVRHLLFSLVAARGLAQLREASFHVEDIIDDLKCQAEALASGGGRRDPGAAAPAAERAPPPRPAPD